ncbi:MAG: DUF3107 family protein [Actinomycetota bacterium]
MDVIFGVQGSDRSIKVQLEDAAQVKDLRAQIEKAFSDKNGTKLLWVTDKDGVEIGIPTDKLAFVEFGKDKAERHVGFASNG